jgi:hypothetical protein
MMNGYDSDSIEDPYSGSRPLTVWCGARLRALTSVDKLFESQTSEPFSPPAQQAQDSGRATPWRAQESYESLSILGSLVRLTSEAECTGSERTEVSSESQTDRKGMTQAYMPIGEGQ